MTTENKPKIRIVLSTVDYNPGDQIPVDIHTEGFEKATGIPELQLTIPLSQHYIFKIFDCLINGFLEGKPVQENIKLQILPLYPPVVLRTITCYNGKNFLRIIMPDPKGNFPGKSQISPYKEQLENMPWNKENFKKISYRVLRE